MKFPFPGIGIVFDIDGLGGGFYGYRAWEIFMKHADPVRLGPGVLVDGDTAATLNGAANEFCIGIFGLGLDPEYIRETFEAADHPGLAPVHRRFIEKVALDQQPLPIRGNIDSLGRLVTDEWDGIDHRLCKENGWSYFPRSVPDDLDAALREELEALKRPHL